MVRTCTFAEQMTCEKLKVAAIIIKRIMSAGQQSKWWPPLDVAWLYNLDGTDKHIVKEIAR